MASEIGKACRDLLPLYIDGDWRTLQIEEKRRAWERVQTRLDLDDILNNPVKFRAADRWMSQLHKKHRADVKRKWKEVRDHARPAGSHDDDWRRITQKWQQELDEEKEILSSNEPTTKIQKFKQLPDDIEFFKQTRYRDLMPDGSGGWVNHDAAEAYDKMVEMRLKSRSSDEPISSSDIVDKFMGATLRSDYYPGKDMGHLLWGNPHNEESWKADLNKN